MGYTNVAQRIYQDLMTINGHFDIKDVVAIALLNSPSSYTKAEVKELALKVLDEALNNKMIKSVGEGVYKSNFSKENNNHTNFALSDDNIIVDTCF
jgi:hypothetical protein